MRKFATLALLACPALASSASTQTLADELVREVETAWAKLEGKSIGASV